MSLSSLPSSLPRSNTVDMSTILVVEQKLIALLIMLINFINNLSKRSQVNSIEPAPVNMRINELDGENKLLKKE